MKIKKVLLTILLAIVAIMLLQLQVNAEEVDYSAYDYLLTETGVIAKNDLTGTETVIAGIKGEYTGEITADSANKKITINNFTATGLEVFDYETNLWIEGENNIETITPEVNGYGNGKIITDSYIKSDFIGYSYNGTNETIHLGNSIDNSVYHVFIHLEEDSLDASGKILDNVAQRICEVIPYVTGGEISLSVPNNTIIPASIFAKLKSCNNTYLCMWDDSCQFTFHSSDIENTNVDFKIGVEFSENPIGNMTILERGEEQVKYIKFKNVGSAPGKVEIHINMGGAEEGEPDDFCYIIIESFNENTEAYEYFDSVEDPYRTLSMLGKGAVLYPQGGYAIYNQIVGIGSGPDEAWCVETEVDSLVWTEEDINHVLEAIEETKNNTTDKQLYVHVPSGSKVPAKIFEAANGIDISIISEDGIWAEFSGGEYKAIDYVAGGKISNKAIDGMVNVGEDTIVYLSLNHEGQLPAKCYISYLQGYTEIGIGGEFNAVKTKLYYFNKDVQKYELCGTGWMDLAYDLYVFEIDHCSSYVMSEEELPAEFVIKTTTGEGKEENKKEEPKKEETKKEDTTTAPGSIPYAGGTTVIVIAMLAVVAVGTIAYKKNKDLRGI